MKKTSVLKNSSMMKKVSVILIMLAVGILVIAVLSGLEKKKDAEESSTIELKASGFTRVEHDEVSMAVLPDTVQSSGVTISITNNTSGDISYSTALVVEQLIGDIWYEKAYNGVSLSMAMALKAKETTEQTITFDEPLAPGKYRIVKSFDVPSGVIAVDVEFEI